MGSEGPKNITFHVTGFKKFQGVTENPTETIVSNLNEYVSKNGLPTGVQLASCTILETAGEGARPALYELFEKGASNPDNESVVWVHLGVNSGAQKFALECQAFNEATFRCPDELGWQPQQVPIVPEDGEISNTRQTTCSADSILSFLKKKGFNVMNSDDAGCFVCNYVYYHSLRFAEARGHKSLFVHVPLFSKIDKETQMRFITSLLGAIAATC
ncbi:uncharacterized protein LOC110708890 [Chenopodium quinoa]|uniref:Pyrrolidone-carboxylate peptidase n=1 Tax=Chenopodium quinoa TaxID=63459 RepID=A0A803L0L8_CHEQI|nr:uncharacterized protein LOC110708890 [Chenopodium quinoa]XP_021742809.1 uncharacterized protein LOC110708890 [Chenopodium quinoa]XP_021742814.1 uncharacterized protein LOC110708890 [Chenopodium quinoa]XP_021742821.1 uncharacterized protein LOC110708890 [Chenopodium quinoa]XP_021742827.1 uncharacterized protein LOC110708890 [Chenopodium quinoa]